MRRASQLRHHPLLMWALRYTLTYLDLKETDEKNNWGERGSNSRPEDHSPKLGDLRASQLRHQPLIWALRYTLTYLDLKETDEKNNWGERGSNSRPQDHSTKL
ncbi:hypothetical protein SDJN03_22459, partial [Cucurbita argyrosperma subsp. sororia]